MGKTKISELPVYTGSTTGVYVVMDSADLTTTLVFEYLLAII